MSSSFVTVPVCQGKRHKMKQFTFLDYFEIVVFFLFVQSGPQPEKYIYIYLLNSHLNNVYFLKGTQQIQNVFFVNCPGNW